MDNAQYIKQLESLITSKLLPALQEKYLYGNYFDSEQHALLDKLINKPQVPFLFKAKK